MKNIQSIEDKKIGLVIKVLRTTAGIKQKDLADKAGIKANTLSLIEAGKREPSLRVLRSISSNLDVPLSFLFLEAQDYDNNLEPREKEVHKKIRHLILNVERLRISEQSKELKK